MKNRFTAANCKIALIAAALALCAGHDTARADERSELEQLRATTMSLIEALVETGAITREKLDILRKADTIYLEEIRNAGLYDAIWQAFAVLLPVRTVGVMGDGRTYDHVCALRAVTSSDGMTADYYPFEHRFLGRVSTRIVNEVKGINRVVYDVTSKPPGTFEWE